METYFHPCIQVDFQLLFTGKIISINSASISAQECFHQSHFHFGKQFFHQSSFHFKVTISNYFVDEMSFDEMSLDEVSYTKCRSTSCRDTGQNVWHINHLFTLGPI